MSAITNEFERGEESLIQLDRAIRCCQAYRQYFFPKIIKQDIEVKTIVKTESGAISDEEIEVPTGMVLSIHTSSEQCKCEHCKVKLPYLEALTVHMKLHMQMKNKEFPMLRFPKDTKYHDIPEKDGGSTFYNTSILVLREICGALLGSRGSIKHVIHGDCFSFDIDLWQVDRRERLIHLQ
ncbi:unnamed protein product, partial [Allacma fusca]